MVCERDGRGYPTAIRFGERGVEANSPTQRVSPIIKQIKFLVNSNIGVS